MSGKVTVTLDGRDVAAAVSELSAACRRLVGAVSDTAVKKREAILRVLTALARYSHPSIGIRKRPILPLKESARNDGDLIGLVVEVGNMLLERGQRAFAYRLMDALLAARNYEKALHILENSCEIKWPQTKTLGGYW